MKFLNSFCFSLSTLYALSLHGAVEYDIIPLQPSDHIPTKEYFASFVHDLSESGFVIGEAGSAWNDDFKGFVYHPIRGFEWIEGENINPLAINNKGIVVGVKDINTIFLYDAEAREMIKVFSEDPISPYGSFDYDSFSISDSGQVLVSIYYPDDCTFMIDANQPNNPARQASEVFLKVNQAGNMITRTHFISSSGEETEFGSLDPYQRFPVLAEVINDHDVVAGVGFDVQDDTVGFVWDAANGLRSFGNLGGEFMDIAAINSLSQVIGVASDQKGNDVAFFFDPVLGLQSLGTLGGKFSDARDINDASQVVGDSEYNKRLEDETYAFIWDRQNGMRNLHSLIEKNSGWKELQGAWKINNKGDIIGQGKYLGEPTAFLMIPKIAL